MDAVLAKPTLRRSSSDDNLIQAFQLLILAQLWSAARDILNVKTGIQ